MERQMGKAEAMLAIADGLFEERAKYRAGEPDPEPRAHENDSMEAAPPED